MKNYLELKVPIKKDATWFVDLRNAMVAAGIPVKWQSGSFHITAAFIYDDNHVEDLRAAFSKLLTDRKSPSLTLDKLDAFVTGIGGDIIVNITASQPSESFTALVEELRHEVKNQNADFRSSFKLHITLGRIDAARVSLNEVKKILNSITIPDESVLIKTANYRYFRGKIIQSWKMK